MIRKGDEVGERKEKTQSCDRFVGTTANLSSLCHVSADSEEQLPFISDILQIIILLVLPF